MEVDDTLVRALRHIAKEFSDKEDSYRSLVLNHAANAIERSLKK